MYRRKTLAIAAMLTLLALVVGAAALRGARGRVILPTRTTVTVDSPEDAYAAWKGAGVRGRILLLFDRYPHLDLEYESYRTGAWLNDGNFLDFAIFDGIVRKIYYVVPESGWEDFRRLEYMYQPLRRVIGAGEARYLRVNDNSGISMVAVTPSSLPPISEKVLVYVNGAVFDAGGIADLLGRVHVQTDVTVVLEKASQR